MDTKTYSDFKRELTASQCTRCALAAGRTHIVVDRGNPAAKAMFIGEAPGRNEDLQGRAFVGRAGKLLDEMLRVQGFETERDALIANVAKCRPPDNRAPKPEEAQTCLPYLRKQIALMHPRLIGLLGATALKHLLPEMHGLGMAGQVGQLFEHDSFPGAKLMVLFHPAYILRDPRKRPLMEEHLKKFVQYWRGC
jgi:uracil-DNA glycosylase